MPKPSTIGPGENQAAYEIGVRWLSKELRRSEAIEILARDYGINNASAGDLIQALKAMTVGERFTRSISAPTADYFIRMIYQNNGESAARTAILSTDKYIAYTESIGTSRMQKMRATLAKLKLEFGEPTLDDANRAFSREIEQLENTSPNERRIQLPERGHKPKKVALKATVFIRSAAVVRTVLDRANGVCELCHSDAPFKTAKEGRPYLEVHHKVRLADGGDDTVENAIALCPNCHRFLHYGSPTV